jgi:hypothetical protein
MLASLTYADAMEACVTARACVNFGRQWEKLVCQVWGGERSFLVRARWSPCSPGKSIAVPLMGAVVQCIRGTQLGVIASKLNRGG